MTIQTLTGDNGLLQKATNAKQANEEASALEKIKVEVAGSYGLDGEIDIEQLNTNLQHIKGLKYNEMELNNTNKIKEIPLVVKFQGELIKINEDGSVSKQLMSINSLEKTKYYINAAGRVGTINDRTYYKKNNGEAICAGVYTERSEGIYSQYILISEDKNSIDGYCSYNPMENTLNNNEGNGKFIHYGEINFYRKNILLGKYTVWVAY